MIVLDWDKAAEIIVEERPILAIALFLYTTDRPKDSGIIYKGLGSGPERTLKSRLSTKDNNAKIQLFTLTDNGGHLHDCYKKIRSNAKWSDDDVWPQSAMDILLRGGCAYGCKR